MPDIFQYTDYRRFLSDYHRERKARDPKFSHRFLALQAGLKSTGFFAELISGKKNLSGPTVLRLAKALKLKKEEEEYFINLVLFNQSKTVDEKNRHYEKLMGTARINGQVLQPEKFEYFRHWYYAAIRELLAVYPWKGDTKTLAGKLNPTITPSQAREAVEMLLETGLVAIDGDGRYRPTAVAVSTGEGFASLNVANFQRAYLDMAREGLDRHPREDRDYSTLTFPLRRDQLPMVRNAVARLRSYVMSLSDQTPQPDTVYQFNFQIFPLSRP